MGGRMAQADSKREEVMAKPWEPTSLAGCPAQLLVFRGVSLTTQIHSGSLSRLWPPPARGIRGQGETEAFLYTPRDTVSQGDLLCIYCTLITAGREGGQGQWPPAEIKLLAFLPFRQTEATVQGPFPRPSCLREAARAAGSS